jgi:hypothetical protein
MDNENKAEASQLNKDVSKNHFVNVKLRSDTVERMISTYEFLVWNNIGEERKECQKILKALKKSLY